MHGRGGAVELTMQLSRTSLIRREHPMFARLLSRPAIFAVGGALLAIASGAYGACTGPGAPSNTQTKCLTAVQIPGNPLRSFDISWVNPHRGEYYLADRSNSGIDIIDTRTLAFKRTLGGFVGVKLNAAGTAVDKAISRPPRGATPGKWS